MDQMLQEYKGITSTTPIFISVLGGMAGIVWNYFKTPNIVATEDGSEYSTKEVLQEAKNWNYNLTSKDYKKNPYGADIWEQLKPYYKKVVTKDAWGNKQYDYVHKPSKALLETTIWRNYIDYQEDPVQLLNGYFWGREHGN